ncbi:MAG: SurA N-terminal domain-containing protein [Chthonomonas sp.]|nr:SurA N-terminal domain-containing protein [Chthonomonas sp.]
MSKFGQAKFGAVGIFVAGLTVGIGVIGLGGCGKGGGGAVASINGEAISTDEWHRYMEFKPQVNVIDNSGNQVAARVAETMGFQAFQDLMRNKLMLQLAKDEGVAPTDKDIEDEIKFRNKMDGNFIPNLNSQGLKLEEIKDQLRIELARERILTKGIEVKDIAVNRFIEKNPAAFIKPPTADMQWILVKTEEAKALVDRDLKGGQSFSKVSSQYSQHPGAKTNTRFSQNVITSMPGPVRAIAEKLNEAQTSDWLKLSDGFAKFYVEKKTAPEKVAIDDLMKESIRRRLAVERGMIAIDLDTRLLNKMKESKIEVKLETLEGRWKTALERLEEIEENRSTNKN